MGYPTAAFSTTTRTNGQTLDASHMNAVQEELTAITGMLLGTITHSVNVSGASTFATLQAGASTHTSLSVSGGSTLGTLQAGASTHTSLSVSGGSTLGTLQGGASTVTSLSVSGGSTLVTLQCAGSSFTVRPITPPPDAALVYRESTYAAGSSVLSTIAFNAEAYLTNSSMHSTVSSPERLTPQSTGIYVCVAQIETAGGAGAAQLFATILDSSGTVLGSQTGSSLYSAQTVQVTALKRFDAVGGYCIARFTNGAGASTYSLSSGVGNTFFSMRKL